MDSNAAVSLIIMYEDESVDVSFKDGSRLQLSPCGCEFLLEKAADPHRHAMQPPVRVQQRSRFAISSYKKLVLTALEFRNKYANRPYLPGDLLSSDQKKAFFSVEQHILWPELSSCEVDFSPQGDTVIKSLEGKAKIILSPSGEEFSVEFTCNLSQSQEQNHSLDCESRHPDDSSGCQKEARSVLFDNSNDCTKTDNQSGLSRMKHPSTTASFSGSISSSLEKPEQKFQSTTVIQHCSCSTAPQTWAYPLSLARYHWTTRFSEHAETEGTSGYNEMERRRKLHDKPYEDRRSKLPLALPLTCLLPHWHRWKFKDPLARGETLDSPLDLAKVVWCQGVTYRILSGAVAGIEISTGDGSVIQSNGIAHSYFTHHKPELQFMRVKRITYHLNSLPPDIPGQLYSVCSVVNRANRILANYNQAKHSLKFPILPTCLQEDNRSCKTKLEESSSKGVTVEQQPNVTHGKDDRLCIVAAELEKIKRFNFLLENNHLLKDPSEKTKEISPELTCEPVKEAGVLDALEKTSRAIQDIEALISSAMPPTKSS